MQRAPLKNGTHFKFQTLFLAEAVLREHFFFTLAIQNYGTCGGLEVSLSTCTKKSFKCIEMRVLGPGFGF